MTKDVLQAKEFIDRLELLTVVIVACFVIGAVGFVCLMFGNWDEEDDE